MLDQQRNGGLLLALAGAGPEGGCVYLESVRRAASREPGTHESKGERWRVGREERIKKSWVSLRAIKIKYEKTAGRDTGLPN